MKRAQIIEHVNELIYDEPLLTYCTNGVHEIYVPTGDDDPIFYQLLHKELSTIVLESLVHLTGTTYGT